MKRHTIRLGISSLIALIVFLGISGIFVFNRYEHSRTRTAWQEKLNLIADARAREVNGWVGGQFRELSALADNASLQIYFSTLSQSGAEAKPTGQSDYLRNLLVLTAQRLGFEPKEKALNQQLGANVRTLGTGGLALITRDGRVVMATAYMPPMESETLKALLAAAPGKAHFWDQLVGDAAKPALVFTVPVYAVQSAGDASSQVGVLVGVRPLSDVYGALDAQAQKNPAEKTLEVALVREEKDGARYLSPLINDAPLLSQREEATPESAALAAIKTPAQFDEKIDYRGNRVWLMSRSIEQTGWTLIAKIDRTEAMAALNAKRTSVLIIMGLLVIALVAAIVALWRHSTARQQSQLAREFGAQAQLLSAVTNHQLEPLYMLDGEMKLHFVNQKAARLMQSSPEALMHKSLADTLGGAFSTQMEGPVSTALAQQTLQTMALTRGMGASLQHLYVQLIPLADIPVDDMPHPTPGVLVVEQDTTEIVQEREMRLNTLNQLVAILVSLVDKRDPNAAEHSARVASLSRATALGMGLDATLVETTETAARLMNIGKVDVPVELLTRDGELNEAERAAIRNSMSCSAELLSGVAFPGPVSETLRQAQEHMDGSGPLKLKGEDILVSARIIAAANALVSMLSPRAYRAAMTVEEALSILQTETARRFDRKVISALSNYLDNQGGLKMLTEAPSKRA